MENQVINETPQKRSIWSQPAVKYGLIFGIISALPTYIIYAVNEKLFTVQAVGFLPMIVWIAGGVTAGIEKRKQKGYLSYSEALGSIFGAMMIAILVSTLLGLLLYTVIDPALPGRIVEMMHGVMAKKLENGDITQQQLDAYEKMIENTGAGRLMMYQVLIAIPLFGVGGLLISLLIAAFVRKEKDPYANPQP